MDEAGKCIVPCTSLASSLVANLDALGDLCLELLWSNSVVGSACTPASQLGSLDACGSLANSIGFQQEKSKQILHTFGQSSDVKA